MTLAQKAVYGTNNLSEFDIHKQVVEKFADVISSYVNYLQDIAGAPWGPLRPRQQSDQEGLPRLPGGEEEGNQDMNECYNTYRVVQMDFTSIFH